MTLERLIETGSGILAVRLVIEGLAYEFVSEAAMEKTTADGRKRIYALPPMGGGISIREEVNIPDAMLELGGQSIQLVENRAEEVTAAVWAKHSLRRFVNGDIAHNDTTITLLSTSGISAGDVIHIGTEAIKVGTVASGTQLTGCTRGYWDSEAKKHWSADGERLTYAMVTDRPVRLRGRRAYIYLYGDGDSLQGDGGNGGSPKWRGFVNTEPSWDDAGLVCRFQLSSVAERLTTSVGGELDTPFAPRGIYYHGKAALSVDLWERNSATEAWAVNARDTFTGFFETVEAFLGSVDGSDSGTLNHWLQTPGQSAIADAGFASTFRAVPSPLQPGSWTIEGTVGAGRDYLRIIVKSAQDGETPFLETELRDADNFPVSATPSTGDILYARWTDDRFRGGPVGYFGEVLGAELHDLASASTHPERRIYLDRAPSSDWGSITIRWADGSERTYQPEAINTSSNYVDLLPAFGSRTPGPGDEDAHRYGLDAPPSIEPLRQIGGTGTLADFRDALVVEGRDYANRGTAPAITSLDLADWTAVINEAARGMGILLSRAYAFAEGVELDELLAAEFKMYGVFPVVEADGKIGVRILRLPTANDAIYTVDEEIVSVTWSSVERTGQSVNTVIYKRGYNARTDEHDLPPATYRDVTSLSLDNEARVMEVAPKSFSRLYDTLFSAEDGAALAQPYVGLFGYPVDYVNVIVSWKLFDVLLGDVVRFQADHLPDPVTGRRGIDVTAIVVGRDWQLGEPYGRLRLLTSNLDIGGYTPTARVLSQTNTGGNTWELTINHTLYAPTDATGAVEANVDTLFEVGDEVRIVRYDSETPSAVSGSVSAVDTSTHVITVDFDATWTPSSATWELIFAGYATVQASQQTYAYIADSTGLLSGGNPYEYGP